MEEMSEPRKVFAPWWIWFTLLAPVAFLAWCGWMFVVVQESHREDAGRAIAVGKLESLERALLDLQQGSIVLWRTPVASDSLERWRELYRNYRAQVKQLEGKDPAIREVMDYLLRLYAAVGRTERIRQELLTAKVPAEEAKALEAEFRAKIDVALAELKTAMLKLRTSNATSDKLPLWTRFATASAVLALITALLLLILGRQMGRVAGAENELAANWRDVRAVESQWQTILNAAPDAFLVADEQGMVRAANLGAQNLIGRTVSDLVGRPLAAVLPALARRGAPTLAGEGPESGWLETETRRQDGGTVALDVMVRKTAIDSGAATLTLLRPAGKGRAEESLRGERDFLNSLFETADIMLAVLDERGRIAGINGALERKTGLTLEKVKGKLLEEALPIQSLAGSPAHFPALKGLSWVSWGGSRRLFAWRGTELTGAGGAVENVVALGVDLTDYLGALDTASDALGKLAVKVSHTLSDALTTIGGYSELLLDSLGRGDPARKDVEQILEAAERAATLTRRLLSFSQKQILRPKTVNLNSRIDALRARLLAALGPGVVLGTELDHNLEPVNVDPESFDEMLLILARNAGEAMPQGGRVTVRTMRAASTESGVWATVSMRDTGTGIDAETGKRLFEPFFTTKDPRKALGLGLATVRGIATQSGGRVQVETAPGAGANISILLPPVEKPAEPAPAAAAVSGNQA
jgi:PAS domain S-box-containing protein